MRGCKPDRPLKVVFLVGQLGFGGSERQLLLLATHLDRARFEPHVIVFNSSPGATYEEALRQAAVGVAKVPRGCRGVLRRTAWLLRHIRELRPVVLHSWTVHDNVYAALVGFLAGVPVRWGSLRGSLGLDGFKGLHPIARSLALRSVARLVVNSNAIREELLAAGLPARRVLLLPNCVEPQETGGEPPDLLALGIEPEARLVGSVANLRPVKNHVLFVRALARVFAEMGGVKGLVVGQAVASAPDYPLEIEREVARLGLGERIVLTGFRADAVRLMASLDVLCVTSTSEGMPNVVLEAMAAGVPVVATRVGGIPELVRDGENGFLVESGDTVALAERISLLLSDESLRRRMGMAGQRQVRAEHSCEIAARRLEAAYVEALESCGRPGWAR